MGAADSKDRGGTGFHAPPSLGLAGEGQCRSNYLSGSGKQMQDKRISDEQIDAAIETVRARRRQGKVDEAVVTIPPP